MSTPPDNSQIHEALLQSGCRQRNAAMDQIANLEAALVTTQRQLQEVQTQLAQMRQEPTDAAAVP